MSDDFYIEPAAKAALIVALREAQQHLGAALASEFHMSAPDIEHLLRADEALVGVIQDLHLEATR